MDHKPVWQLLKNFMCAHKGLREQYETYLDKNKNFNGENFCEVLLLFDLFLESLNKKQKQIKTTSPLLKSHAYKISLIYNRVRYGRRWSRIPWWNEITEKVYLGALPLQKHANPMQEDGVKRVLSMVEPFEHENSYAGKPMKKSQWDTKEVGFKSFPSPDFKPISLKTLYKAACYVKESVDLGETIYIHCKAGRGRSAAVVQAYLMLFKNFSYKEGAELIRSKRPHIDLENKKNNIEILHNLYEFYFLGKTDLSFFEDLLLT